MSCKRSVVLGIGDLHSPFTHCDANDFLAKLKSKIRPTRTVFLGDISDQHAFSRFVRSPSGMSASFELSGAAEKLEPIYDLFPDASVCWGNHDERIYDRVEEAGVPRRLVRPMREILKHPPGWHWRDRWDIDGVTYEHGTGFTGKDAHIKAATGNMGPTVIAHIHAHAGIAYIANRKHLFWGFNVGCLIDNDAYAFAYAKRTVAKPIIGAGVIENGVPRFIPMLLNRSGRWVGSIK
jgi:hypothetical protein